jgi:hypothetical protein
MEPPTADVSPRSLQLTADFSRPEKKKKKKKKKKTHFIFMCFACILFFYLSLFAIFKKKKKKEGENWLRPVRKKKGQISNYTL